MKLIHGVHPDYPVEFEEVSGYFWTMCGRPVPIELKYPLPHREEITCSVCRDSQVNRFPNRQRNKKYLKIRQGWGKDKPITADAWLGSDGVWRNGDELIKHVETLQSETKAQVEKQGSEPVVPVATIGFKRTGSGLYFVGAPPGMPAGRESQGAGSPVGHGAMDTEGRVK